MDPLKFQVAITDNATKVLEGIQTLLNNLKDVTINVAAGGELKSILSQLEKGGIDFGDKLSKEIEKATAALGQLKEKLNEINTTSSSSADKKVSVVDAELDALKKKESSLLNSIAYLKQEDEEYQKVAKSIQKVYDLIQRIDNLQLVSGGGIIYGNNIINKDKVAGDMQSFLKSIQTMEMRLQQNVNADDLRATPVRKLIENIQADLPALKESLAYAKKLLKENLGTVGEEEIRQKIALLETLKKEYQNAASVLTKHGASFMNYAGGDYAKEALSDAKRELESIRQQIAEKEKLANVNKTVSQSEQQSTQLKSQIAQQEQKIAELRERLAQATQKQSQGDQQTAQTLNAEAQAAGQAAGQLSKLLADKNAVTEAENKLAQASMTNVATFIAEGESAQKAAGQLGAIVMLLERISQLHIPDASSFAQSLSQLAGIKTQGTGLEQLGAHLGDAAEKIEAAKNAIKGGRFGELAKRINSATEAITGLDAAFEKFHLTIGKDQGLKDFMTGLGEVIRNVRTQMQSLGVGESSGIGSIAKQYNRNVERMEDALYRLQEARIKVANAIRIGESAGMDVSNWRGYLQFIEAYERKLQNIKANEAMMMGDGWQTKAFGTTFKSLLSNADDFERMAKQAAKENDAWAKSMRDATSEANKLDIKIRALKQTEADGARAGANTTQLREYIHQLELYKSVLDSIAGGNKNVGHTSGWMNGSERISGLDTLANTKRLADESAKAVDRETKEIQRNSGEKQKAASSTSQLTAEEQRLAQAMNQTTEHAKGQSQVLSDLKSMAMQYLGVWGGQQFLHNIIEIGGQLEMQRMSIGSILQNQSQANDLFEKIKGLVVQSPFGVVELDQMTKQLTAYGFKYSELFDMTKRLADISAATGTGVDRLALALGHVRSEAALSGYTLRQFSMGNVPLLAKLSEKLGKTTQEIRKMVRAKEISYEDVEGVIKDLTNEGGMFYNMQETISQSVKARFKNVKDAMAIMYGEMAESGLGDVLKSIADNLMTITKNWKDVATVVGTGAAVWSVHRAAVLAMNFALGSNTSAVFANILAYKKKRAAELQNEAMVRKLTAEETLLVSTRNTITASNIRLALSNNAVTKGEVLKMIALRKVNIEEAKALIRTGELTAAEVRLALQGKILGISFGKAGAAVRLFSQRLWAATSALLSNPWTWIIAGLTAMVELWQRNSREMERAQEVADNVYERSQEALKNTRTMMQETDIKSYWRKDKNSKWEDVSGNFGGQVGGERKIVLPSIDTTNAQEAIEKWSQYIKDYAATPNSILNNALFDTKENVRSLEEQFNNLKYKVVEVADAQVLLQGLNGSFEDALKGTNGGWFDDDLITNIEDYNKSLKEFGKNVSSVYKSYRKSIDIAIKSARQQDDAFDKAVQSMGTYAQQFEFLVKNQEDYTNAVKAFKEAGGANAFSEVNESGNFLQNKYYKTTFDEVKEQQETMEADMNRFFITMDEELERKGYKIGQMTVAQQQAVLLGFKTQFEGLKLSSQDTLDYLMELVSQHYGIELDVKDELFRAKVDEATRLLNGLVNGEWKVDLNFATNINDVIDKARKNYKTAKEYFENAKPIMMKFGVNASFGKEIPLMKMTEILNGIQDKGARDFVEQVMKGWNEAAKAIQQSIDASTKGGFSLEDPNKSKKNKNKDTKKHYKDPDVERWKERMKNLKAAYDEYEKLEKEFGHDEAILRVKRAFKGLIDEKDIDNIKEYRKELVEIKNKALDRFKSQKGDKSKDYGKQAQQLAREAEKAINDIDLGEQKRRSDEYLSKLKLQLDELKKQWETFNKVRMATNNEQIAAQVAGLSQDQASKRDIANSVKANIQGIIKEMGGEVKVPIKFDVTSSDKDIENNVKAALGGSEKYREQIKGIVEAIKTWRDLERDAMQKSVDAYTQAITKAMDYESQVARINAELAEQNRLIDQNNKLSQEQKDKAKGVNQANASMKALEASDSYKRFFNNVFGETKTELQGMANTIKAQLNYSLKKGAITAEEYAKKIKDIDDVMKQSEISDPDKWYNKGIFNTETMEQRNQRKYGEGNEMFQKGADMLQQGLNSGDGKLIAKGKEMKETGQNMMKGANQAALTMAIIDKVVHGVDQSIQGTVKAFDYLKETLDALGVESDTMSSVGDYLHTLGEMSSHVTQSWDNFKNGNFVGASVEAFGAVTSVIKGISQAHDNRLERAITKLREDVKSIEANTELIAKARERTLGYDMGDIRRQMAQQYAPQSYGGNGIMAYVNAMLAGSQQNKSMYEYYSKNSQGTGYQQEYENLVEQRKKYLEILKDQQDKKKKSNDEIEETKSKIAELDDQISHFTQDLAKELWNIDIKGWADQLSDALASAFENGENMAKAYRDTVTNIIQQMMQKMMQMAILEPMFERLQKQLFGENGKGGVFDPNNPKGSMSKVTAMISDFFGKGGEGEKAITASMEFMTAFQRAMQNAGLTVLNEASNTLSSSMQGTTEETSGLLAGYVNALRQDVSVNRILITQFVTQMWPDYMDTFANQVTAVQNIDTNVQVIMMMMQMGSGAMYEEIAALRSRIDNVVMGIDKFSIK